MNPFLAFLLRTSVAIPTTATVWLISFFAFDQTFLMSSLISLGGGTISYLAVKGMTNRSFLKKHQLTRKEYVYIKQNLDEAKRKIARLNKALFSIKHVPSLKQRVDILRITRKIYNVTKKEPKRFYQAEKFYFSHLDSLVELTEKYVFLSNQPKKSLDLEQSLHETRRTLDDLAYHLENDLNEFLANDMEQLNFEIDVAKKSIKPPFSDESRRLK
ncbi:5-bromo-4-chloroindolyl phosphate hydrolysis family protein [Cytobacillus sp. FJAT-54145]|uniref:5-bromo-4-chloroindolyl phosphate hydrolysis family protein n=1 Tax=Cytobacillus spartinae TaxID=3299023 RepID=A0ABW6KBX5_9BACI